MSNTLRITGMATGMDTDTMVQQLMKAENIRMDKLKQDRQLVQWRQELYRDIIGDLNTFKSTYFDAVKPEKYMMSANSFAGFDVTSTDSVSTAAIPAVTATAGAGAIAGNYQVKVNQMAKSASFECKLGDAVTKSTKLSDLGVDKNGLLNINYNGATKPVSIAISKDETLGDLINKISTETSGAVTAKYSELTHQFSIETNATGNNSSLEVSSSGDILSKIGFATSSISGRNCALDKDNNTKTVGKNASVTITPPGGAAVTVTKETNIFTIDGITYSLKSEESGKTTNINVTNNSTKVMDKIKDFVGKYNELIDKINTKTSEKKQYSYKPLTDDQKKGMKEDEIKKWEETAKQGLLKGDNILQSMLVSMRQAFSTPVDGTGVTLKDIGLSTSSDWTQKGKIVIDENKLKTAIETKGEQVLNLFTKTSSIPYNPNESYGDRSGKNPVVSDSTKRNDTEGILQRLNDIFQDNIRTTMNDKSKRGLLLEKAGIKGSFTEFENMLSKDLKDKDKAIYNLSQKLIAKENKYYSQFAKLESAMQKLNSQSNWLMSQLGGMK